MMTRPGIPSALDGTLHGLDPPRPASFEPRGATETAPPEIVHSRRVAPSAFFMISRATVIARYQGNALHGGLA